MIGLSGRWWIIKFGMLRVAASVNIDRFNPQPKTDKSGVALQI
jgi:hypothetical protein